MATWVCATCGPVPAGAIRHLDHDSPHGHEQHECGSSAGLEWTTDMEEHEMTTTTDRKPGEYAIVSLPMYGPNGERLSLGVGAQIVAPGLAITPDIGADQDGNVQYLGGFLLILLSTGHNLNGSNLGGQCISCIRAYAQAAIASGIDWTKPHPEINALLSTEGDEFKAMRTAQEHLLCCEGFDCQDDDGF